MNGFLPLLATLLIFISFTKDTTLLKQCPFKSTFKFFKNNNLDKMEEIQGNVLRINCRAHAKNDESKTMAE